MKNILLPVILGCVTVASTALAQPPGGNPKDKWDISKLDVSKLPPAATTKDLTFDKDIKPIFEASCIRCHGEQRPRGGLRVDSLAALLKGGEVGEVVKPGSGDKSLLILAVSQMDRGTAMPPLPRQQRRPGAGGPGGGGPGGPGGGPGAPGGGANLGADADSHAVLEMLQAPGDAPPGGPGGGPGGPGGGPGRQQGPPPKPLTPEQVGIVRAWIDQGAK